MTQDQILSIDSPKHVKIYKLKQLGLTNSAIAGLLETNPGHVYNALKDYRNKPEKVAKADAVSV